MSDKSSGTLRKDVNRAEFFRWGADSLKQIGKELINFKLGQLDENSSTPEWNRVADEKSIGIIPRLFFVKGTPVFVLNEAEKGPIAFSANCPEEGGLLEWRENVGSFCCPFCQSKYDREGRSHQSSEIALTRHETKVLDAQLLVRLKNSSRQLI